MSKKEMRKFVENSILSGYRHHSFDVEREISDYFLKGSGDRSLGEILNLATYEDILGPDRLRAGKNGLICLVTIISRSAIRDGADPEISFSMSDYFLNEIEKQQNIPALQALKDEIISSYRELVDQTQRQKYSFRVARAVRYMHSHVYGPCTVSDAARFAGCSAQYLSSIFQKEVGEMPKDYIRTLKMREAPSLIRKNLPVHEISDILGYCNPSHFIREFRKFYHTTPKGYSQNS